MTTPAPVMPGQVLGGHNRISTQALTSLARVAAAQALGVDAQDVRADWTDDDGLLALSLVAPISIPPLQSVVLEPARVQAAGGSVWDRTVRAKATILATVSELSGSRLSRVDIRISGARISTARTSAGGRVR
ncbi:hypothetical protein LFT44_02320 [Arthrobacter sp. FW306-05-C]|uniref:hypothetical protein n=1 Tax=Arthrobacter TaxID=1663 RepID=UPI001EEFD789|nr:MULTISPECIES: hypothetical protein [Arthrobacter]MDP9986046.1 hypothetical protein [Arthrobacter oryzae]UKA67291.1 hypothetical protein LFT44_02320 [Arthrobacter sp. FW306-05-C]UKA75925.1 hypothetical protein LFT46_02305 [Arthrobacter sp. FW306-07-I]